MAKDFNNENTISVWRKVAKSGNEYYSGVVYIGNVPYNVTMFDREPNSENSPIMTGKVELREAK